MNRTFLIRLAAAGLIACVIAVGVAEWQSLPPSPTGSSTGAAIADSLVGQSDTAMAINLQPASDNNQEPGAVESLFLSPPGEPQKQIDEPDGSEIDLYLRADGSVEYKLEYFPPAADGHTKLLKHGTRFAADGITPLSEIQFGTGGLRQTTLAQLPGGNYRSRTYFGDGLKLASEALVGQGPEKWDTTPTMLRQTRWNEAQQIVFLNVLNADNSHDITIFDDRKQPIEMAHLTQWVDGSRLVGFYPGGKVLRVRATSTYALTSADVFRPDGTLSMQLAIGPETIDITYFDASGHHKLFNNVWWFTRVVEDGMVVMRNFKIYTVTQLDANDAPLREWDMITDGPTPRVWTEDDYNVTADGVRWGDICNFYDDNGLLEKVSYIEPGQSSPKKMIDHHPSEGIRSAMPPPELMVMPKIEDIFAIPEPQTGH